MLIMRLEAAKGSHVTSVATALCNVARTLNVRAETSFNDILLIAGPDGQPNKIVAEYDAAIERRKEST